MYIEGMGQFTRLLSLQVVRLLNSRPTFSWLKAEQAGLAHLVSGQEE